MNFLKELFKPKTPSLSEQDQYYQEVLKSSPTDVLSFLNKRIVLDQRLVLPVAESMIFIEHMHQELLCIDKKYGEKARSQKQWVELYHACLALMLVKSTADKALNDRYYKLTFVPRIKEIIETVYTNPPLVIGPRKSAKVKFLEFAKTYCKSEKPTKTNVVQPQTLLEWYAVSKY